MNNDSKCENRAINFLLFSYFGVTADDDDELILNAAIKKAHADATMQGAYNAMFKKEDEYAKKHSNEAAKECTEHLIKEIRNLSSISSQEYKVWHNKVCKELIEIYAENLGDKYQDYFSYGNAQKWINMLMKYLCIFYELGIELDCTKTANSLKDKLHVPIDSYILEAYCSNKDELSGLNQKKSNTPQAWSKMNWEDYEVVQDNIQKNVNELYDNINLMDWESKAWIAVAKKRKRKKSK